MDAITLDPRVEQLLTAVAKKYGLAHIRELEKSRNLDESPEQIQARNVVAYLLHYDLKKEVAEVSALLKLSFNSAGSAIAQTQIKVDLGREGLDVIVTSIRGQIAETVP